MDHDREMIQLSQQSTIMQGLWISTPIYPAPSENFPFR